MSETEEIENLETKIIGILEQQLAAERRARAAFREPPGEKPAAYWTHHANIIRISQQLKRKKGGKARE